LHLDGRGATRIAARMKQLIEERQEALTFQAKQNASVA
jgi:hypothetical protein